jgi:hypothetical protein
VTEQKPQNSFYVATQDSFAASSVPVAPDRPTRLIGVAAPGLFTSLSFLQDQRHVTDVVGINTSEKHLKLFRRGMELWEKILHDGGGREDLFAEWLGWDFPADPYNAEPRYLDQNERVFLRPDVNEVFIKGAHGTNGRRFAINWLNRMPRGRNGSCLGWDYGWLDPAMFFRQPPPFKEENWLLDDLNYALETQLQSRTTEDVVIYLSNLLVGGDNVVGQLRQYVKEISGAQGVYVWVDADTVRTPQHRQQYFGDNPPYEIDPATRPSPHAATLQALGRLRTDGTLLELHPHGVLTRKHQFRSYWTNGSEAFLQEPKFYDTISLHIMSCFHHGDHVVNDKHIRTVLDCVRNHCNRLLIMDQNPHTRDHLHNRLHNSGTPISYYRSAMEQQEEEIVWCRGVMDMRRNYFLVFNNPGA